MEKLEEWMEDTDVRLDLVTNWAIGGQPDILASLRLKFLDINFEK